MIKAFDRAAENYDQLANVQRTVADELFKRIAASIETSPQTMNRGLEIGCGTGFLTKSLLNQFPATDWVISDASPKMVETCRHLLTEVVDSRTAAFCVLDGEQLSDFNETGPNFDLICSSLAFQWFADLPKAIAEMIGHLNRGGELHFSTLADTNFRFVYDHFPESGIEHRRPEFLSVEEIEQALVDAGAAEIEIAERRYSEAYPNLRQLLHHLKAIGAATPGRSPAAPSNSALRKAIRESIRSGHRSIADYHVLIVSAKRLHPVRS